MPRVNKDNELSEKMQQQYIEAHPLPVDDFLETVRIRTQTRDIADDIVLNELIYR